MLKSHSNNNNNNFVGAQQCRRRATHTSGRLGSFRSNRLRKRRIYINSRQVNIKESEQHKRNNKFETFTKRKNKTNRHRITISDENARERHKNDRKQSVSDTKNKLSVLLEVTAEVLNFFILVKLRMGKSFWQKFYRVPSGYFTAQCNSIRRHDEITSEIMNQI